MKESGGTRRDGSRRILFVEDNEATRYAVNRVLTGAGYRIATAETGEKGLALAHDLQPDLLLLDVRLPDMSGFELVRRLKADPTTASIPIVHLSASHLSSEDQIRGLQGGADAYLTHPVEPRVLVATLAALLRVRLAEARYRRLFGTRLLGILQWRRDGVVTDANDAFLEIAGLSRAALEAGTVQWNDLDPRGWSSRRAARTGVPARPGRRSRRSWSGRTGRASRSCSARRSSANDGGEGVSFVLDISDRKRAEEALREADRRKDEFLAVLSHELRNPLAPIRTAIAILDRADPGSEQASRARGVIARQVDHLTRLVDDLLDVTRIARGKVELRRTAWISRRSCGARSRTTRPCSSASASRSTPAPRTRRCGSSGIRPGSRRCSGTCSGTRPSSRTRGGRVVVSLEREGDDAVVRVRDAGIGSRRHARAPLRPVRAGRRVARADAEPRRARPRPRAREGARRAPRRDGRRVQRGPRRRRGVRRRLPLAPSGVAPEAPEVERPSQRRSSSSRTTPTRERRSGTCSTSRGTRSRSRRPARRGCSSSAASDPTSCCAISVSRGWTATSSPAGCDRTRPSATPRSSR